MVTNDIANFYVAQNDAMRSGDAVKTSQFLKSQLEEAKRQLDVQEGRLRAYTSAHNGELPQQVDMNLATLDRLNTQLRLISEQQIRTLEQRQRLMDGDSGVGRRSAACPRPIRRPPTCSIRRKPQLGELESRFTSKHPDVHAAEAGDCRARSDAGQADRATPEEAMAAGQARGRAAVLANLDAELEKQKREEESIRGADRGHRTGSSRACRRASRTTR